MVTAFSLIETFKDTQNVIRENDILKADTLKMQNGTMLYFPGYECMLPKVRRDIPEIFFEENTTFRRPESILGKGKMLLP